MHVCACAAVAAAVGLGFGLLVLYWMSLLTRKHEHSDITIQVALTVVAAYICFYVSEAILKVRGSPTRRHSACTYNQCIGPHPPHCIP